MKNTIDNLKFDIKPTNPAMALMQSGFIPNGEAKKNGWDEVRDISENMQIAVAGLFQTVLESAKDVRNLGGGELPVVKNIYSSIQQDVEQAVNSVNAVKERHKDLTGFFRGQDDTMRAQEIVIEYQNIFERTHQLTMPMMVELTEALTNIKNSTDPKVVTDVTAKEVSA